MYKVKTTNRDRFKVRSSIGVLDSEEFVEVGSIII